MQAKEFILVTGATGYIGAHTVLALMNAGHHVLAVGNSKCKEDPIILLPDCLMRVLILAKCDGSKLQYSQCNLMDTVRMEKLFITQKINSVVHLASSKGVAPSIIMPLEYYDNNLTTSLQLFQMCEKYYIKKFIFMSSATVYGIPEHLPVYEKTMIGKHITNPYGWAKYMVEQIIHDVVSCTMDCKAIILRIFDPAGAHPSGILGEDDDSSAPKHLMALVAQVAMGKRDVLHVCGNTFPTRDGSGSRDFVHVVDVAQAAVCAISRLEKMEKEKETKVEVYNIGLGKDHTVLEMIDEYQQASGKKVNVVMNGPRPGDIPSIYCDITMAKESLMWKPFYGIQDICVHLNKWYTTCPKGFNY